MHAFVHGEPNYFKSCIFFIRVTSKLDVFEIPQLHLPTPYSKQDERDDSYRVLWPDDQHCKK